MEPISHKTRFWKKALLACMALVLSVALHAWVLIVFPDVPIGKLTDYEHKRHSFSTVMDRVDLESRADSADRPESFSLDHPSLSPLRQVKSETLTTPWIPHLQDVETVIANAQTAAVSADELPQRKGWSPRQDVIDIDQQLFSDDVAALPRRLSPDIPRQEHAPDWSPPSPLEELESLSENGVPAPDGYPGDLSDMGDHLLAAGPGTWADTEPTDGVDIAQVDILEDSLEVMDESPEEISEVEALESLLDITVTSEKVPGDPYTYFELQIFRAGAEALPVIPKDVMVIQDASKSMTQRKLDHCIAGIYQFLGQLHPQDRFNVVTFRDGLEYVFEDWQTYKGATLPRLRYYLDSLRAEGKTDVSGTLGAVLQIPREDRRPILAVLVTDGRPTDGLVNTSDIIVHLSEANQGNVSVFALGGGQNVNRFLLDMLSYKNRGDSFVISDSSEIPPAMKNWADQLNNPVLTDLSFRFSGVDEADVFPKALTHLFLDRPLTLYGRTESTDQAMAFRIEGENHDQHLDIVFELDVDAIAPFSSGRIRKQWAWQKSLHLISQHILTDDDEVLEAIRSLRKSHDIKIPYGRELLPIRF